MMTVVLLISLALAQGAGGGAKTVGSFKFDRRKSGRTARVIFNTRTFAPARHRVTRKGKNRCPVIDGREPLGTDCTMPRSEIESIALSFDGVETPVPPALFADCYNPNFDEGNNFGVRLGDDLKSLFVLMSGSDGAGSYTVIWVLRSDGRHTRLVDACSDCRFIDFEQLPAEKAAPAAAAAVPAP